MTFDVHLVSMKWFFFCFQQKKFSFLLLFLVPIFIPVLDDQCELITFISICQCLIKKYIFFHLSNLIIQLCMLKIFQLYFQILIFIKKNFFHLIICWVMCLAKLVANYYTAFGAKETWIFNSKISNIQFSYLKQNEKKKIRK